MFCDWKHTILDLYEAHQPLRIIARLCQAFVGGTVKFWLKLETGIMLHVKIEVFNSLHLPHLQDDRLQPLKKLA
jgi:hypothetical protein